MSRWLNPSQAGETDPTLPRPMSHAADRSRVNLTRQSRAELLSKWPDGKGRSGRC